MSKLHYKEGKYTYSYAKNEKNPGSCRILNKTVAGGGGGMGGMQLKLSIQKYYS